MLVITFIIAVLNICLGYALARYLGYVPAIGAHAIESNVSIGPMADIAMPSMAGEISTAPGGVQSVEKAAVKENEPSARAALLPYFDVALLKGADALNRIDGMLRERQGQADQTTVENCLGMLREDCSLYSAELNTANQKFNERIQQLSEFTALCKDTETNSLEHIAQIESTLKNLQELDLQGDLEAAKARVLEEIRNLSLDRNKLRDNHQKIFAAFARYENRLGQIENTLLVDQTTGLLNRIGLERKLFELWEERRLMPRTLSGALLDIDKFAAVSEKFGPVVGDLALQQFGEFLRNNLGAANLLGRYSGQQFMATIPELDPSEAVKSIDAFRQLLETAVFMHEEEPISLSVTGAVVPIDANESYPEAMNRLETALLQAKSSGPNHLVFVDGDKIEPVELPKMQSSEEKIVLHLKAEME